MDSYREFEGVWGKFLTLCKAKLMEKSKQCALTASAAQMAIADAMSVWYDPYQVCGQWLRDLARQDPKAGENVIQALEQWVPMQVPQRRAFPEAGVLGATACAAAAGVGVGVYAFHLGTLGLILSAAIPAAVMFPAMKGYQKSDKERAEKAMVQQYLEQLSLLKEEIDGYLASVGGGV